MKTNMKRKIVAISVGLLTTILVGFTSIVWGQTFSILADNLSSDLTKAIFGTWEYDQNEVSTYYFFYLIGLSLALGATVTFIAWDFKDSSRRRLFIYFPFFILIFGFSVYNYAHFDYIMKPDIQVVFNLFIILFGLIFTIKLWTLEPKSTDGIILKYFVLFVLILCADLIPLYFTFNWLLKRLGLSNLNLSFDMPIISTITGLVSTVITVLKYQSDKKKLKTDNDVE